MDTSVPKVDIGMSTLNFTSEESETNRLTDEVRVSVCVSRET